MAWTVETWGGHPDLATSLNNMGHVLWAAGSAEQALP